MFGPHLRGDGCCCDLAVQDGNLRVPPIELRLEVSTAEVTEPAADGAAAPELAAPAVSAQPVLLEPLCAGAFPAPAAAASNPAAQVGRSVLQMATEEMLVELRGVPLRYCFSNLGSVWESSAGKERDSARTARRDNLDCFLSHDWGTGRALKLLTLAVHFNGVPALIASYAVSGLAFLLQVFGVLTQRQPPQVRIVAGVEYTEVRGVWCFPAGIAAFFVILLYWQVCRACVLPPIYAFLDKMCINQRDPEEKKRGVHSLGGFLQNSDRMLMICTRRYFSRMWCVFEVAAWLQLKDVNSIVFLPPSDAMLTSVLFSIVLFTHLGICISIQLPGVPIIPAAGLVAFCMNAVGTQWARLQMRELMSLPELLRAHDIDETHCYCCTHKHVDPVTKAVLPCDRDMVYHAIDDWYATGGQCGTARFNQEVRTSLAEALDGMLARPVSYASCLIAASPSMWYFLDIITAMVLDGPHDAYLSFRLCFYVFTVCFIVWPLMRASVPAMAKRFRRLGAGRCAELGNFLAAFGAGSFPIYVSYLAFVIASQWESMSVKAVIAVLLVIQLVFLLCPAVQRFSFCWSQGRG